MDEGIPRQCLSYPFVQVSSQSDHPDIGLSCHPETEEDWSSSSTVELMSDIYACLDPALHSQLPSAPTSGLAGHIGVTKITEPAIPLPTHARRGGAVPCTPRIKLRVLRPASTRIRKPPPELPRVSETKTATAAQPRRRTTKTSSYRITKPQHIAPAPAPAPAVEVSTMTLCEQEQEEFMQLLRDTIESNRNARNRYRTPLPTEDAYTHRGDREQTLDIESDCTAPTIEVGRRSVGLPEKRLYGVFEAPTPALQIIGISPSVSPTPSPINDGVVPAPAVAHRPVLALFR